MKLKQYAARAILVLLIVGMLAGMYVDISQSFDSVLEIVGVILAILTISIGSSVLIAWAIDNI